MGSGVFATILLDASVLVFGVVFLVTLVGLVVWRRLDHNRSDYLTAWWRSRFGVRAYDLLGPDVAYTPLGQLPSGCRVALERLPGTKLMTPAPTTMDRLKAKIGLKPSALSEQLPLWDVVQDAEGFGILVTPQGGAVIGYDLVGLHTVYADGSRILDACRRLYSGAARLPDRWEAQFFLHAGLPNPRTYETFTALRDDDAMAHEQCAERVRYLKKKRPRFFRLRVYVSQTQPKGASFCATPDLADALKAAGEAERFLGNGGLRLRRLSPEEIFSDVGWVLRGGDVGSAARAPSITKDESPREALMQAPVTWTPDAVRVGGRYVKVLTLSKLQGTTSFSEIETLFLQGVPFDFRLVAYVRLPSRVRTRANLDLQSRLAHAAATGARVPSGLAQVRFEELRSALDADLSGDQRVAHFGLQVAVWGRSLREAQENAEALQNRLLQHNYTLLEETGRHHLHYLTNMVPGGLSQFDRWIQVLSTNVVDLLPLFDSRGGDAVPACLMETDRGELWAYDPSAEHRSNWNSFVVGASGSGKSVFVNALIANACRSCSASKGRVLVVDFAGPEKSSYLMLARVYGGRFLPVIADGTGLNPFPPRADCVDVGGQSGLDGHTESFLTVLVDLLIENQARGKDTKLYRNLTQEALRELYAGDEEPGFDAFVRTLEAHEMSSPDERRRTLISLLVGTLQSPGGRLFASADRLVADEPFVIFDLFGIEAYSPEIREAIVFTVCETVRRLAFSSLGEEERKKYIILDEVAQLVRQEGVVTLIRELYGTARKHGTAVTTVTQKYTDFVESGLAETVRSNSTTGIFLSHASDAASQDRIARDMSFNGRERHLFRTLHIKKNAYSEFLLRVDNGDAGITTAKLRLGLPPFEVELYTSDVEARRRQERIRKRYPRASTLEVLRRAARRSPS